MKFNPNKLTNLAFLAVSEDNFNSIYELLVANDTNNLYLLHWCNYDAVMNNNDVTPTSTGVEDIFVNIDKNIFCFFEITKEALIDLVNQKISYLDIYKSSRAFYIFNESNPTAGNWFRINTISNELLPKEGDMFDIKKCRDLERLNRFIGKTDKTDKTDKTEMLNNQSKPEVKITEPEVKPVIVDIETVGVTPSEMENVILEDIASDMENLILDVPETELTSDSKPDKLETTASDLFNQESKAQESKAQDSKPQDSEPKKYNFKTNPNFRNNKK